MTPGSKPEREPRRPSAGADAADQYPVRIVLSEGERATFFAALVNPPPPNERLIALAARHAREVESRS